MSTASRATAVSSETGLTPGTEGGQGWVPGWAVGRRKSVFLQHRTSTLTSGPKDVSLEPSDEGRHTIICAV